MKISPYVLLGAVLLVTGCASLPGPQLDFQADREVYISPRNGDGVQDSASVSVSATAAERRALTGYRLEVLDQAGDTVSVQESSLPEASFWKRMTASLGFRERETMAIPEELVWEGRSEEGSFVPDGRYRLVLTVWDNKETATVADPVFVVVDNTAPTISLSIPYRIFSPNGDGNKDILPLSQVGSSEDRWEAGLYGEDGSRVAFYHWAGKPPAELLWDGRDERGRLLPDGIYRYYVSARDRAGNIGGGSIESIGINTRPTLLSIETSRRAFSPNGDGVAESVTVSPVYPTDGLEGWLFEIMDTSGQRLIARRGTGGTVFEWDGRDSGGESVPDGSYVAVFSAVYENGNSPRIETAPIVVDTLFPRGEVSSDLLLFSPEGDGFKDRVTISHRGASRERDWLGELRSSDGALVYRRSWGGYPSELVWDGRDLQGKKVEDGQYRYTLSATDEAGNAFTLSGPDLVVDTRPTAISLRVSSEAFSPNGDGILDAVSFEPALSITEGIQSWRLVVRDSRERAVRSVEGEGAPRLQWGGLTDNGTLAGDGRYIAELAVVYQKGNRPSARSVPFVLDTVAPSVSISSEYTLFSPDGDGRRDTLTLVPTNASNEESWAGEILDSRNGVVVQRRWSGAPEALVWNGRDAANRRVPDGEYRYRLTATDRAGNRGVSEHRGLKVDTQPRPVGVHAGESAFSPNGDGVKDQLRLTLEAQLSDGIDSWKLDILDGSGRSVRSFSGSTLPRFLDWDGRLTDNRRAPEAGYRARLEVSYLHGARPIGESSQFVLDTVAPTVRASGRNIWFSPEGDGRKDRLIVTHTGSSEEELWIGTVTNSRGTEVRRFTWPGRPGEMSWDGNDSSGAPAEDGLYRYSILATDGAGNIGSFELPGIRVDRRPTPVSISLGAAGFSPDGNGVQDTLAMEVTAALREGLSSWELLAIDGGRVFPIRRGSGNDLPARFDWNGRTTQGEALPEGSYYAAIRLSYEKGNSPEARTAPFVLDVKPPELELRVLPLPFSPDEDGENDTLRISPRVRDASRIEEWQLTILDPVGNRFTGYSGRGEPSSRPIEWDGRSVSGELVQSASDYTFLLAATDVWGNRGEIRRVVPTDILVIREGDRLRIQISSIYFAPFSTEFQPGKEADNGRTLQRLSEILKRYPDYRIAVEGHAVRIYWYDEARGDYEERETLLPLSTARAAAIKETLVNLGIPARQMTTVGFGGTMPMVPHSDLENRWKNRRVEFILRRQ